jgi:4,5-DOPA dioxygenase extradiol
VQLSLVQTLDPSLHIQMGKALRGLDWKNLLVVGSGFSFHNMRAFFSPASEEAQVKNIQFDDWLRKTMSDDALSENIREQQLLNWEAAPSARYCHPREEHLMPLHVCYGMAGKASEKIYQANIMKKQSSMFFWAGV